MGLKLMLVPWPQPVKAMNPRTGEVRWSYLAHLTVDIRDIPNRYEAASRRFRDAGGVVIPPDEGEKGE